MFSSPLFFVQIASPRNPQIASPPNPQIASPLKPQAHPNHRIDFDSAWLWLFSLHLSSLIHTLHHLVGDYSWKASRRSIILSQLCARTSFSSQPLFREFDLGSGEWRKQTSYFCSWVLVFVHFCNSSLLHFWVLVFVLF